MIAVARRFDSFKADSGDREIERARRLYCEVLDGRPMAEPVGALTERDLCFLVAGVLVETGAERRDRPTRVILRVRDPESLAARCWNAGFTVFVDEPVASSAKATVGIVDPFGLRIELRAA